MGDPARKEERDRRDLKVRWIHTGKAKEVAGVIESHKDHDDAAHDVDGFDAGARGGRCFDGRRQLHGAFSILSLA